MRHGCDGQGDATIDLPEGEACPFCGGTGPGSAGEETTAEEREVDRMVAASEASSVRSGARRAAAERKALESLGRAHSDTLNAILDGHRALLEVQAAHRVRVVVTVSHLDDGPGWVYRAAQAAAGQAATAVGAEVGDLRADELELVPGGCRVVLSFEPARVSL